ncbi:MAG TPA: hypothetical protein VIL26_05245 [Clostridia bacterium]
MKIKKKKNVLLSLILTMIMSISVVNVGAINLFAATADVRDGDTYVGRVFDEDYDIMVDNFDRETVADDGVTSDLQVTGYNRLEVDYTSENGNSYDESIYKSGSGINAQGSYRYLILDITATGGAVLSDLVITFAFQDTYFITKNVSDLLSVEDAGFEFDGTDQLLRIDLNAFDEENDYMVNINDSNDKYIFNGNFERFHLMSHQTSGNGSLEIREIYFSKDGTKTENNYAMVDDFSNPNLGQPYPGTYWRGSIGTVINQYLIADDGSYKKTITLEKDNVVFTARAVGEGADISLKDSDGTEVAWADLKGPDNQKLPEIGAEFTGYVINLGLSGLSEETASIEILAANGDADNYIYIDKVFLSDMEIKDSAENYPALDTSDILMWDTFNRERTGANSAYVADDPYALSVNMSFIVSYKNIEKLSIKNNKLVIDATTLDSNDYIHYGAAAVSEHRNDGSYKYLVFKMKGTDGATLNNFRFNVIDHNDSASDVKYASQLLSDVGYSWPALDSEDYPYTDEDGYRYFIADLALSGLPNKVNGLNIYYSGAGKLYIDSIFFANRKINIGTDIDIAYQPEAPKTEDEISVSGYNYFYLGGANVNQRRYLALEMRSDGEADFSTVRLQGENTVWFKDGGWYGLDGLKFLDNLTDQYQTFYIDLEMSGIGLGYTDLHGHFGEEGKTGSLYIRKAYYVDINHIDLDNAVVENPEEKTITFDNGYAYGFGMDVPTGAKRYLSMEMKGAEGTDLNTIRIEFAGSGEALWFKDNVFKTIGGKNLDITLTTEYKTFVIDLAASGVDMAFTAIHFHSGDAGESGTVNVRNVKIFNNYQPDDMLTMLDEAIDSSAPTVSINTQSDTYYVDDVVSFTVTAQDNVSQAQAISIEVTVVLTNDDSVVTVTDNSFIPTKAGVYLITVTAQDEAGNISTATKQITVDEAEENPKLDKKKGLNAGQITGIVIGSVALAGIIAGLAIYLIKRKKS